MCPRSQLVLTRAQPIMSPIIAHTYNARTSVSIAYPRPPPGFEPESHTQRLSSFQTLHTNLHRAADHIPILCGTTVHNSIYRLDTDLTFMHRKRVQDRSRGRRRGRSWLARRWCRSWGARRPRSTRRRGGRSRRVSSLCVVRRVLLLLLCLPFLELRGVDIVSVRSPVHLMSARIGERRPAETCQ